MAKVSVKVEGLEALRVALRELPLAVQKNVLSGAVRKGAIVIRDDAQARAPVLREPDPRRKPGTVRDAIRATRGRRDGSSATAFVYVRALTKRAVGRFKDALRRAGKRVKGANNPDDPFYWRFLEFGTSKLPARPFLRPAFDARKEAAVAQIRDSLKSGIEREARKVHGRRLW